MAKTKPVITDSYTDADVCAKLGIATSTLRKYMSKGTPRKRFPGDAVDLRKIPHNRICGKRRWNKEAIDTVSAGGRI